MAGAATEADLSVAWSSLDLEELFPKEVEQVLETIDTVIETISAIIDIVVAVLDILALLLLAAADLMAAAVKALIAVLEAAVEFFIATTISTCWIIPRGYRNAPNGNKLLGQIAASFNDETDVNRPFGDSESNFFLMWTIIAAVPNLRTLFDAIDALMALFKKPLGNSEVDTSSWLEKYLGDPPVWPPVAKPGGGQLPDWNTARLADLTPFDEVVQALLRIRENLMPALDEIEQLKKRIELIQKRIHEIEDAINKVLDIIKQIAEVILKATGIHVLSLYGQGSTASQVAALQTASQHPDYPFKDLGGLEACGAFCLHVQAGVGGTIDTIKNLLAMKEGISEYVENLEETIEGKTEEIDAAGAVVRSADDKMKETW